MIGHRTPRHAGFRLGGGAARRSRQSAGVPASGLLIVAAAATGRSAAAAEAWRALRRDAPHHRSPNAGYPEAAIAGALGLALAGPRVYGGIAVADALMGYGRRNAATADDIRAALALLPPRRCPADCAFYRPDFARRCVEPLMSKATPRSRRHGIVSAQHLTR